MLFEKVMNCDASLDAHRNPAEISALGNWRFPASAGTAVDANDALFAAPDLGISQWAAIPLLHLIHRRLNGRLSLAPFLIHRSAWAYDWGLAEALFEMKVNKLSQMTLWPPQTVGVSIADFFALEIRRDKKPQVRGARAQI
jgi:hypothetical protein